MLTGISTKHYGVITTFCLQKLKTVIQKTVKNAFHFTRKDIRNTKTSYFWNIECGTIPKIELKLNRVDLKRSQNRPIYVVKLFFAWFRMVQLCVIR